MTNTHEEPLRALAAKEEEGSGPTAASAAVGTASGTQPTTPLAPVAAVLASTVLAACGGGSGLGRGRRRAPGCRRSATAKHLFATQWPRQRMGMVAIL